ncbi:hypothetical protein MTO96_007619 [Rhipicephalus appendiculatus]
MPGPRTSACRATWATYSSRTSLTLTACHATPCVDDSHPQGLARCIVYVKRELLQAEVPVADLVGGPFECCAVRMHLDGEDTAVASVYIRPCRPWDPSCLRQPAHRLGKDFLLCAGPGDNTGAVTHLRRGAQATSTAIDLSVATEGCRYAWSPFPDTWGLDHLPILLTPFRGKAPRDREYRVVDWRVYRQLFRQDTGGTDLLQLVADNARAATVIVKAQQGTACPGHPAPSLEGSAEASRTSGPEQSPTGALDSVPEG